MRSSMGVGLIVGLRRLMLFTLRSGGLCLGV